MPDQSKLSNEEKLARHRLIRTSSVGPITFKHLIARYESAIKALEAIPDLAEQGKRKKPLIVPNEKDIIKELKALKFLNGFCLHYGDTGYPARLMQVDDAPPILYCRGNAHLLDGEILGIVGARNASAPGLQMTRSIATTLTENAIVIASGLARGIDTAAHKASLKGGTIACMAGGLDVIYPKENDALYDAIAKTGLLITEMPLGTKPQARHFPRRNRLISGISMGVLVIEAAEKSGSLITARFAAEQGREVFALPGSPADPRARGGNKLIKDGAILVQTAEDILFELSSLRSKRVEEPEAPLPLFTGLQSAATEDHLSDKDRRAVIDLLSPTPVNLDEIIRLSEIPAGLVLGIILELELAGRALRMPGNKVVLLSCEPTDETPYDDLFS